jgi:hypothetical protein
VRVLPQVTPDATSCDLAAYNNLNYGSRTTNFKHKSHSSASLFIITPVLFSYPSHGKPYIPASIFVPPSPNSHIVYLALIGCIAFCIIEPSQRPENPTVLACLVIWYRELTSKTWLLMAHASLLLLTAGLYFCLVVLAIKLLCRRKLLDTVHYSLASELCIQVYTILIPLLIYHIRKLVLYPRLDLRCKSYEQSQPESSSHDPQCG